MNTPPRTDFMKEGFFSAFVIDDRIEMLCRSSDWYELPPIQRYLYNMAACQIRMEDARTETRVYTFERFDLLRSLIRKSLEMEWEVAWEAWLCWGDEALEFGVVHLDQRAGHRGNLIVGDDPMDVGEFAPDDASILAEACREQSACRRQASEGS